jgi:hypothetical protein
MLDDLQKKSRKARKAAAEKSADEIGEWYREEKKKLAALRLEPEAFERRRNELLREYGKRGVKAENRAKYQLAAQDRRERSHLSLR